MNVPLAYALRGLIFVYMIDTFSHSLSRFPTIG